MSGITTSTGLISGLDIGGIVDAMIRLQSAPIVRLRQRAAGFQSTIGGFSFLEANLLSLTTAIQQLGQDSTFNSLSNSNTNFAQLLATTSSDAVPGTYQFQAIQTAATHELLSKGFANTDQQSVGTGTLTIAQGGSLHQPTLLSTLNNGNGIRRGVIRITDRGGQSVDVDLSSAFTVDDVLDAINTRTEISVVATTQDGQLVLTDTSGSTLSNFTVADLSGGHAAEDLGIAKSLAASVLTGDSIFAVTGDFTLDQLNDGNGIRILEAEGEDDFDVQITLTDDTVLQIDLDGVATINDVLNKINNHADNLGKLSATLVDGHFELTDLSGGGGTSAFSIENNTDNTNVVSQLGLDTAAVGSTISGRRLVAGLNSVLLRNVNGGAGISQTGEITLTDRAGTTATIDLTGADSLDQVLSAINAAQSAGGTKLQLTATINSTGTGITVQDTSGSTVSNLIIADVGGGTLAADLKIAIDAAETSVDSGFLSQRYVNEATTLATYTPDGGKVKNGAFLITDSAGNTAAVTITTAAKTIGDVIQRINSIADSSDLSVRAELNSTGDGFVLIDEAGGPDQLVVEETTGNTAADLRILGTGTADGNGVSRIESRLATIIEIDDDDTLDDIVEKINAAGSFATATVIDDGSAFSSKRLVLTSTASGTGGQLIIEDDGLLLGFETRVVGQDALLRNGPSVESGFLISSNTNNFKDVFTGLDIEVLQVGDKIAEITVSRNTRKIEDALDKFVSGYNQLVDATDSLTKFDLDSNTRGVLQGEGTVLRILSRLDSLVNRRSRTPGDAVASLADLGIRVGAGGKLTFNRETLKEALDANPQAVNDFFLTADKDDPADFSFAELAQQTIDSFTDSFTGSLTLEKNALQSSIDSLDERIEQLNEILDVRRDRLFRQFVNLETILGELSAQQNAIFSIAPLFINPAGRGIL